MNLARIKRIFFRHLPVLARVQLARIFPALYGPLRLRPSSAWINVTDNCNMRCIMCNQWKERKEGELNTEEWLSVLNQLSEIGVEDVSFGGGEPLLVRDLPLLIKHSRQKGMQVGITTSGYLLNERKLEELLEAGVTNVTISIDGVGADYERIRGREWSQVLRGVELLAAARKAGRLDVVIGFVLMRPTARNYPAVEELARRLDIPVAVSLVDTTPFLFKLPENANENWFGPSSLPELAQTQKRMASFKWEKRSNLYNAFTDIDFFESYFKDPLQKSIPCSVSQIRIMINGMGDVYGGCWSMGHFGNLREKSLRAIVESERYRDLHRHMFYKRCPGCSCGYSTSNRYDFPTQIREMAIRLFRRPSPAAAKDDGQTAKQVPQ